MFNSNLQLRMSLQAPQWLDSDSCQKCEQPFFWNIKQMWDTKTLGLRQVGAGLTSVLSSPLSLLVMLIYGWFSLLCSTTAGSVARLYVENVVLNAPLSQLWASNSRCECVMPALIPSKKRSEYRASLNFVVIDHIMRLFTQY